MAEHKESEGKNLTEYVVLSFWFTIAFITIRRKRSHSINVQNFRCLFDGHPFQRSYILDPIERVLRSSPFLLVGASFDCGKECIFFFLTYTSYKKNISLSTHVRKIMYFTFKHSTIYFSTCNAINVFAFDTGGATASVYCFFITREENIMCVLLFKASLGLH